jgi:prepilin-type processing-associated H-X9-DG protein
MFQDPSNPRPALAQKVFNDDLLPSTQKMVESLKSAGARHVYWVATLADLRGDPFFMVIPLEGNANADEIQKLLPTTGSDRNAKIGNAVVRGPSSLLERLKTPAPTEQPELAKAFDAIGDAPVRCAIAVTPEVREVIAQTTSVPKLAALVEHLNWIAATAQLPPRASFKAIAQAENPESAKKAAKIAGELLATTKDASELNKVDALRQQLSQLQPVAQNDRVVLAIAADKMKAFAEACVPAVIQVRMQQLRVLSMVNAFHITREMIEYTSKHGEWPKDIDAIANKLKDKSELINPAATGDDDGYKYLQPTETFEKTPSDRMIVYEAFDDFPQEGVNVSFADGHAERVTEKERFEAMLKDAQDHSIQQVKP